LGHGEAGVHNPLSGGQGTDGGILALVGTAHTHGPALAHGDLHVGAVFLGQDSHHGLHVVGASGGDTLQSALDVGGHHDLVEHHGGLGDGADDVAALHFIPGLGHGSELPQLLGVDGGNLHATGQAVAPHHLHDLLQGSLDSIVDILNHAGAQLHAHGVTGGYHLGAGAQAGGLLVDLNGGGIPVHGEDLTDEALGTHTDHVGHVGVRQAGGHHQGAGDLNYFTHIVETFLLGFDFCVFKHAMAMPRHNGKWYDGAILCQTEAWLCRNPLWISKSHNDGMAQKGPSEPQPSWRGIAPSKNIRTHSALHRFFNVAHADALAALFAGNENDGR